MRTYTQQIGGVFVLDDGDVDALISKLREVGSARRIDAEDGEAGVGHAIAIEFSVEAPNDFDLALAVVDVREALFGMVDFEPDRSLVTGKPDAGDPVDSHDLGVRDAVARDIHRTLTDEKKRGCDHDLGVNSWTGMPDPPLCVIAAQNAMDTLTHLGLRMVRS